MNRNLKYYRKWRNKALIYLGGKCVICGSTTNLEFDHIIPKNKQHNISELWSLSFIKQKEELDKCQILCHTCHLNKHKIEIKHGTLSMYVHRRCRCILCREYWNNKTKEYKAVRRSSKGRTADFESVNEGSSPSL